MACSTMVPAGDPTPGHGRWTGARTIRTMSRLGGRPRVSRLSATQWAVALALPLAGLALLLAQPSLDVAWEHQPSHFWLVLGTAVISVGLAVVTNVAAGRHRDARIVLVSLTFLASAGFLGLHALATPGILLDAPNAGFAVATPVGPLHRLPVRGRVGHPARRPPGGRRPPPSRPLLGGLVALMLGWAFVSLAGLPPLGGPPPPREAVGPLVLLAAVGVPLYAIVGVALRRAVRRRGGTVLLAMAVAIVLLGEAAVAVALSRNWRLSWWEWHVLMLLAFLAIALGARAEYRRSGSLTAAFGGLYLETTLTRLDRWHAGAIAAVAASDEGGGDRSGSSTSCGATARAATRSPS